MIAAVAVAIAVDAALLSCCPVARSGQRPRTASQESIQFSVGAVQKHLMHLSCCSSWID